MIYLENMHEPNYTIYESINQNDVSTKVYVFLILVKY